jgi:hypothetical protein
MMRVLTVRQPWAHAIAHLGKDVENRTWSTRHVGEQLAIHAGRTVDLAAIPSVTDLSGARVKLPMYGGGVVAVVDLVEVHSSDDCWQRGVGHCSPWGESGAFHWVLADVRPLAEPFELQGALGLRVLPADFEAEILRRVAVVTS